MAPRDESRNTSYTLLERALDLGDQDAWDRLHTTYISYVRYLLLQIGVRPADVDDVSQAVFFRLSSQLPKYDRSISKFRTWFHYVIKSSALMHFRKESSLQTKKERFEQFCEAERALEDNSFEDYANREWEGFILTKAIERIKMSRSGKAAEVFELGLEGLSANAIAEKLGLEVASVYTIRKRIKKTLNDELEALKRDLEW